jgi:hypothetical protein
MGANWTRHDSQCGQVAVEHVIEPALRLPTHSRPPNSFEFYRSGLGFEPIGELAEDGVPEPCSSC